MWRVKVCETWQRYGWEGEGRREAGNREESIKLGGESKIGGTELVT